MRQVVACVCIASGLAAAAPRNDVREKYKAAAKLAADDDNEAALKLVDEGLALAPKDLPLLQLRGTLLLKTRDYNGALVAYQAYLDAGAKGANKREAIKILNSLRPVKTTFLDLTAPTSATIYLDTKTAGVFCTAPCKKAVLPGDYKVIAEKPGWDRFTTRISVEAGKVTVVDAAMVERPSALALKIGPEGAAATIDGQPVDLAAPPTLPAGSHQLVIKLAGHATYKQEIQAHEGKPLDLDVTLVPLVPIEVSPANATLVLDDKPAELEDGGIVLGAGAHKLVATAPDHHDLEIAIPASRDAGYKLTVQLAELGAFIDVHGAPSGARMVVDGKTIATAPFTSPVEIPAGRHDVALEVTGYRPYRTAGTFGQGQKARLHLGKLRRDDRRRTWRAGIATGGALVVGSVFSVLALSKESDYRDRARQPGVTIDDSGLRDLESSGKRYSLLADVGFGLAIVGIGVTGYLFTHEGRGASEGSLELGLGMVSGHAGAVASGRF